MIRGIIFDLDGVLVNTEDMHYHSILDAIVQNTYLSFEQITSVVKQDGTSSKQKLALLQSTYKLSDNLISNIDALKQTIVKEAFKTIKPSPTISHIVESLSWEYPLALASNSREDNVLFLLDRLKIRQYFPIIVTPTEHLNPKPAPDLFHHCSILLNIQVEQLLVLEDSISGWKAVESAGCQLFKVMNMAKLTLGDIQDAITKH